MTETVSKSSYRDTLKSSDTEEHIDLAFYRPIGYMWACAARALGITPNVITIASIFLGVGAGIAFYFNDIWINVLGIVLLVWANSFDSADGQLARMTKQYSRLGRILDGVAGDFWFISIYFAICFRENATSPFFSEHPWLIWVIAVNAGLCHAKQASMADYYRQFHLYFLKGEEGSELDSSSKLNEKYVTLSWRKNFWQKLVMSSYLNYTKEQERLSPDMQSLRAALKKRFGDGAVSTEFRNAFREKSLPLMKYTNILSFNWRSIVLFASILACMPWLYFAFELIVLNALLVYMVVRHNLICANFTKSLNNGSF
jgi:hypothetical protein